MEKSYEVKVKITIRIFSLYLQKIWNRKHGKIKENNNKIMRVIFHSRRKQLAWVKSIPQSKQLYWITILKIIQSGIGRDFEWEKSRGMDKRNNILEDKF